MSIVIPKSEFVSRIERFQAEMAANGPDAILVYGDEYRKENLRYVCNFWPIFERAVCLIPKSGPPTLVGAPEGETYAREMSVWENYCNVKEFACVTVPEEIDYPLSTFRKLSDVIQEALRGGRKLGIVGLWDIPAPIFERIKNAAPSAEIVDAAPLMFKLRLIKSANEVACLAEAGRQACEGYKKLLEYAVDGNPETMAAGAAEGAARMAGAEDVNFMVFGSGKRTETVIGRATNKIMRSGEMVMAAMAVQYQGYVSTVEYPFVIGKASDEQKRFLNVLFEAANLQQKYLKAGVISGEMVKAVKAVFAKHNMTQYDLYPPMHGIGLAEAESPYPDENATYPFEANMCVNSDISLWGCPAGSNRIEEGFVITEEGPRSLTPLIRGLVAKGV
ncbi:MAG: aminopeptidase P family protein [Lentisphaerae bacterium]|jgi:Xaa-Pro aminopeptidase|nr:aminopeptidase P family protein [Lentisphaerota bacterium]